MCYGTQLSSSSVNDTADQCYGTQHTADQCNGTQLSSVMDHSWDGGQCSFDMGPNQTCNGGEKQYFPKNVMLNRFSENQIFKLAKI